MAPNQDRNFLLAEDLVSWETTGGGRVLPRWDRIEPVRSGPLAPLWPDGYERYVNMRTHLLALSLSALITASAAAHAQGTVRGAERGAEEGGRAAGPLGAFVGGAVGAVTGTVGGILGVDDRPRFREYVVRERRPSYRYNEELRVGAVLPDSDVTYYEVPAEYNAPGYRYTYVNERAVLVEPRTGRIVEILD